jgi:hypothetical protein
LASQSHACKHSTTLFQLSSLISHNDSVQWESTSPLEKGDTWDLEIESKVGEQETLCVVIFISNQQKCHVFLFIFYVFFFFTKLKNRRAECILSVGVGPNGRGRMWGKCAGGVNILQILCIHVCKWENNTCWNYSRNGRRRG